MKNMLGKHKIRMAAVVFGACILLVAAAHADGFQFKYSFGDECS